jgi:hypothetical protein
MSPPPPPVYDLDHLPQDLADRIPIVSYHVNDQETVQRSYIWKGPFKHFANEFKKRNVGTRDCCFNVIWFYKYHWLEYNVKNDATFCFVCFLFKKGRKNNPFTLGGWRNWNRDDVLDKHVGDVGSAHNTTQERYNSYLTPGAAIDNKIVEVTSEEKRLYKI